MALLLSNPDGTFANDCPICSRPLAEPIFATTHFVEDPSDPLWPFSDAGMHWDCYASWKHQRRFASQYFDAACQWKSRNPYWPVVAMTDAFLLTANPSLDEPMADLALRSIGPGFRVSIRDWDVWIHGGWDGACIHDVQRSAMIEIENDLRTLVPTSEALQALAIERLRLRN